MLEIKNLSIWYKPETRIIDHADLSLEDHSIIGLLGVNGAGKTTLINTISGIHSLYSAQSLKFDREEMNFADDLLKAKRYTVFTEEQAFMYWDFDEYIKCIGKIYNRKPDSSYLDFLIEGFGFQPYRKQLIKNLSTGNKKKVYLIAGFSLRLPLLILDEPLDGLDFNAAEFLYEVLQEHKEFGSVFMSSHIAESFEKTCDRIILLKAGKLIEKQIQRGVDLREELQGWLSDGE